MKKKYYIRPESASIMLGDDLMDLGGLSVQGKNPNGDSQFIGVDDGDPKDNDMENEARAKNFTSVWEDDAFTGHIPDELFD